MRKTPLRPGTKGITRKSQPKRTRTQLPARNPARLKRLKAEQYGGPEYLAYVTAQPCVVCRERPCEACHRKSRGAGGTWRDLFPGCMRHHREQHDIGIASFEARYGLDLEAVCAELVRRFEARRASLGSWGADG